MPLVAFARIVQEELRRQGASPISVAQHAGLNRDAIRSVLRGRVPSVDRAAQICEALGLEFYVGPSRDSASDEAPSAGLVEIADVLGLPRDTDIGVAVAELKRRLEQGDQAGKLLQEAVKEIYAIGQLAQAEFQALHEELHLQRDPAAQAAAIFSEDQHATLHLAVASEPVETPATRCLTVWDIESAAGGGALFDQEAAVGFLAFRRAWLDQQAIDAKLAAIISVRGESMEPTLPAGSAILVDRGRHRRREDRVFVVRTEDGLLVKRVGKDRDGHWQLRSDNPTWRPVPWSADAEVVGEVRWMARTLG